MSDHDHEEISASAAMKLFFESLRASIPLVTDPQNPSFRDCAVVTGFLWGALGEAGFTITRIPRVRELI